jgi:putative membrane protein
MKNLFYMLLGTTILFALSSCSYKKAKNYNSETNADQDGMTFIKNGLEGGLTEIKASSLAITNSSNQRVLMLAKMMIDDHTKAGDELKKIKGDKDVIAKDTINTEHLQMIHALSDQKGPAFDRAYLQMMVADHEKAVALFAGATRVNSPEIKDFAAKTLPAIQMHLDSSRAILASLK